MEQNSAVSKSLTEQILQQTLMSLESTDKFDPDTLDKLKQLASDGNLKKHGEVSRVIRPSSGESRDAAD